MDAIDLTNARNAILRTLFRSVRSYSSTSCLAELSTVPPDEMALLFNARQTRAHDLLSKYKINTGLLGGEAEKMAPNSAIDAQNSIAAACLVFSHSLADGAIADFCMIAADYDRKYWVGTVEARTLTINQVANQSVDDLLRSAIRGKIKEMSLPTKMNHLLKNAGPFAKVEYDFAYDKTRLQEMDHTRHEIIHGPGIRLKIEHRDSQEFLFNLTVYAGLVTAAMLNLNIRYPQFYIDWLEDMLKGAPISLGPSDLKTPLS